MVRKPLAPERRSIVAPTIHSFSSRGPLRWSANPSRWSGGPLWSPRSTLFPAEVHCVGPQTPRAGAEVHCGARKPPALEQKPVALVRKARSARARACNCCIFANYAVWKAFVGERSQARRAYLFRRAHCTRLSFCTWEYSTSVLRKAPRWARNALRTTRRNGRACVGKVVVDNLG